MLIGSYQLHRLKIEGTFQKYCTLVGKLLPTGALVNNFEWLYIYSRVEKKKLELVREVSRKVEIKGLILKTSL